jgi:hypothetical protein
VDSVESRKEFVIFAILWPERGTKLETLSATFAPDAEIAVSRPDGKTDRFSLTDEKFDLRAVSAKGR